MRNLREPQQARLIQLVPPRPQPTTPLVPAGYAAKENKRAPSPHKPAPDSASPALVPTRHLSHEWRDPPPDAEPTRIDRQSNPPHPRRAPQTLERGPVRAAGAVRGGGGTESGGGSIRASGSIFENSGGGRERVAQASEASEASRASGADWGARGMG
jgi:hypothetical protein